MSATRFKCAIGCNKIEWFIYLCDSGFLRAVFSFNRLLCEFLYQNMQIFFYIFDIFNNCSNYHRKNVNRNILLKSKSIYLIKIVTHDNYSRDTFNKDNEQIVMKLFHCSFVANSQYSQFDFSKQSLPMTS